MSEKIEKTKLKRNIGWIELGLYGLGTVLGAGVYATMGSLAAVARGGMLLSLIVAGVVAVLTALTFAALATRYPVSEGVPYYLGKAFNKKWLNQLSGLLLTGSGVVIIAALLTGFHDYVTHIPGFQNVNLILLSVGVMAILTTVAIIGMKESAWVANTMTIIEVGGLLLVILAGLFYPHAMQTFSDSLTTISGIGVSEIVAGVFIAYFAFIGFDAMITVSEEVKNPEKNIKRAIYMTMTVATMIYLAVAVAFMAVLPTDEFLAGEATLVEVFQHATGITFPVLAYIGAVAIINGVLTQTVMCSRILYGMSEKKELPSVLQFSRLSKTKTPYVAIIVPAVLGLGFVIWSYLAGAGLSELVNGVVAIFVIICILVQLAAISLIRKKELKLNILIPSIGLLVSVVIFVKILNDYFV